MPQHRPNPHDLEWLTLSFRVLGAHSKMVHAAAAMKNMSAASYMRKIVVEWAAADLGVEAPDYNALSIAPSQIAEAAKQRGLTVAEFTRIAVREATARQLQQDHEDPVQERKSDFHELAPPRRTASGTQRKVS